MEQLVFLTAPDYGTVVKPLLDDLRNRLGFTRVSVAADGAHIVVEDAREVFHVATHLKSHVVAVVGPWSLVKRVKETSPSSLPFPGMYVTPEVVFDRYGQPNPPPPVNASQACAEFEQAYFYPTDVAKFQAMFNLSANPIARIVGPNHPQDGYIGEASLDTQWLSINGVRTWVYSIGSPGMDLLAWYQNVTATTGGPHVHSISWGSGESSYVDQMEAVNTAMAKLAALGHTVFVSSGDNGAGHTGLFCGKYDPTFPAVCPWVTSVGGTFADSASSAEEAWNYSGGGFSNVFPRPAWQDDAVKAYLSSSTRFPKASLFNKTGRGIPDVSALSTNFGLCGAGAWIMRVGGGGSFS